MTGYFQLRGLRVEVHCGLLFTGEIKENLAHNFSPQ